MSDATTAPAPDLARCPLSEINAFDPAILQDPYPYFARLRAQAPVFRDPRTGIVSVSTYDLVMKVATQPQLFSNDFSEQLRSGSVGGVDPDEREILKTGIAPVNTMLTADPPAHTRYRRLANKGFTHARVEAMGSYVAAACNTLIDGFIAAGRAEFKTSFASQLPMIVIADALGVPRADIDQFRSWSEAFVVQLGGVADKAARLDAAHKVVAFQRYFIDRIEDKRAHPTEDIISDLVHANLAEDGDPRHLDHGELLSILQQLLVAGNETTAHALTAGLHYLITHPDQMAAVRADPGLIPNLVEETLRLLTPTNNMWRVAMADTEIGGFPVAKGELILLRFGAANRDDARFADGERFDVRRDNAKKHLAFGAGIHTCIGAQLARKEMGIAFPILLDRLHNIRLAPDHPPIRYDPNILLRGIVSLDIVFDPV